jgi:hypothetical protein
MGDFEEFFAAALYDSAVFYLNQWSLTPVREVDLTRLKKVVTAHARKLVASITTQPGSERHSQLWQALRFVTSSATAKQVVEQWIGLTDKNAPGGQSALSIESEALVTRGGQLTLISGPAELEYLPAATRIGEEVSIHVNKRIDFEEWVRIDVAFRNAERRARFSTSVSASADDSCLWVNSQEEIVLGEVAPNGVVHVPVWFYVTQECTNSQQRLRLTFTDTHRPGRPISAVFEVKPTPLLPPRLVDEQFDTDEPGSSDGSKANELTPGLSFEYSANVTDPSWLARQVEMSYRIADYARPLFSKIDTTPALMTSDAPGRFFAGDDLDATLVSRDAWPSAWRAAERSSPWLRGRRPLVWLAFDLAVSISADLPPSDPPETATALAPVDKDAKGKKRKTWEKAPDVAKGASPASGPVRIVQPLDVTSVADLVTQHIRLVPRPSKPLAPAAVAATDGYEVVFDRDGFKKDYLAALTPAAPAAEDDQTPDQKQTTYFFTFYRALPIVPPAGADEADHSETVVSTAPAPAAAPPPPPPDLSETLLVSSRPRAGCWHRWPRDAFKSADLLARRARPAVVSWRSCTPTAGTFVVRFAERSIYGGSHVREVRL